MKSMRERPYCSGVSQERLKAMQEEYRRKLCDRIDRLLSVSIQHGGRSQAWEEAWADFSFAITTFFDGNDPKVMRLVMEEVMGHMTSPDNCGCYPSSMIEALQDLLSQDAKWVDEDAFSQESSDEEVEDISDQEDKSLPVVGVLTPNTLFGKTVVDETMLRKIKDGNGHAVCGLDREKTEANTCHKRAVNSITPDRRNQLGEVEKKTISPDPEMKKRRVENSGYDHMWGCWPGEKGMPVVTPELDRKEEQGQLGWVGPILDFS